MKENVFISFSFFLACLLLSGSSLISFRKLSFTFYKIQLILLVMEEMRNKFERQEEIQLILSKAYPEGYTSAQLARKLNVHRSTIARDIDAISSICGVYRGDKNKKWYLKELNFLNEIKLNTEEIGALHLASRLLGRKVRFSYPAAASALRKFSQVLYKSAKPLVNEIAQTAELFESHSSKTDKKYAEKLKIITTGIVRG